MEQRWREIKTWHFLPSPCPNLLEAASPPLGKKKKKIPPKKEREGCRTLSVRRDPRTPDLRTAARRRRVPRWLGAESAAAPRRLGPAAARSLPGQSRGREEKSGGGGRGGEGEGAGRGGPAPSLRALAVGRNSSPVGSIPAPGEPRRPPSAGTERGVSRRRGHPARGPGVAEAAARDRPEHPRGFSHPPSLSSGLFFHSLPPPSVSICERRRKAEAGCCLGPGAGISSE